jgi:tRNA-specific adenosine deaminase 1
MESVFTCTAQKLRVSITESLFIPILIMYSGGDASMELIMASQEDSTPWDLPALSASTSPSTISSKPPSLLHGRGYFSALGQVRGKPSRPDAPLTLSKSCSDKLALKQSTSLLSSLTSLLISPQNAYLTSLVLPSSQYSETACTRAFSSSGRLTPLKGKEWGGGYAFREFKVLTTEKEFAYSRRQALKPGEKLVPSNITSISGLSPADSETLIGGTLQGRKQFSLPGASRVCKRRMWQLALSVAGIACQHIFINDGDNGKPEENKDKLMGDHAIVKSLKAKTYAEVKEVNQLEERMKVKREVREAALIGWVRNEGGDGFGPEELLRGK